jgi:hypothetical protein
MANHPVPSLALIAFDAAKRRAAARAQAERQRQLFLELADPRYCPGLRDPRLLQTAEDDDE